ncbi:ABC transporter ATP-binding protein/permease [Marinobacterium nitratireducens]|uniref:ABC transporter ATP-binding protein/permease n=1 Tax=Marinobacterium nitratireducens TaxID=518897 RepID=A0A917ZBW0_9GAMM|nr:ABC transporter ATP-binding protein/permease [Marinobacterium nitratireducens]
MRWEQLPGLLAHHRVAARLLDAEPGQLGETLLPCLIDTHDGQPLVLLAIDGQESRLLSPVTGGELRMPLEQLRSLQRGRVLVAHPAGQDDWRAAGYARAASGHWFRDLVGRQWRRFAEVALASLLAALLAVASALFVMQVYDRVLPTRADGTLWALALGVFIAIGLEFLLRALRSVVIEQGGKRLDLALSRSLFQQAISLRLASRPGSTGAFASQMRDFEIVREFFTASTLGACGDLPFSLLFLCLIAFIGGPVALVPLAAIVLIVLPSLLCQPLIARLAREGMREAAVRNALLLESVDHLETLKTNRGEGRALATWQRLSASQSARGLRSRNLNAWIASWTTAAMQLAYVASVIAGVYLVFAGELTAGALIACSLLTSRALAPFAQVSQLLARWQQVRVAFEGLDELMQRPVERPEGRRFARLASVDGHYRLESVCWRYDAQSVPVLALDRLEIRPGQRWVLLGGNGSGKSTLLRLLAGLFDPASGSLRLDDRELAQVDPVDRRRHIGYMPQDIALFQGTLRDNLLLGGGDSGDDRLVAALDMAGLGDFVRRHPLGLDLPIAGNQSLSGGQRQSVGLARLILQDPPVVLMDEPTAALDQNTENRVIRTLEPWLEGRTLVLATHKRALLAWAEYALVLQQGQRALDGPLQEVLSATASAARRDGARQEATTA